MNEASKALFMGFKGKNNASSMIAQEISDSHLLLTNSFEGLKRDIEGATADFCPAVIFGIDKNLKDLLRIERNAQKGGSRRDSSLDIESLSAKLNEAGLKSIISQEATHYLCNEAYWHALGKFNQKAVLIHIPPLKHIDKAFIDKLKTALLPFAATLA